MGSAFRNQFNSQKQNSCRKKPSLKSGCDSSGQTVCQARSPGANDGLTRGCSLSIVIPLILLRPGRAAEGNLRWLD